MQINKIHKNDTSITVEWANNQTSNYYGMWLRDNCRCSQCFHPITEERISDTLDIPTDIMPVSIAVIQNTLYLTWPDGHKTNFTGEWLWDYRPIERTCAPPYETFNADTKPEVFSWLHIKNHDYALWRMLEAVDKTGFAVITNAWPDETGQVLEQAANRVAWIDESNFGRVFTVENKPNPNNIAYTTYPLKVHTDLPNRSSPSGLQMLHSIRAAEHGGESILVDGALVAETLWKESKAHALALMQTPVDFRFQDDGCDLQWRAPIIGIDEMGKYVIRYSEQLAAPMRNTKDNGTFYAALQHFMEITRRAEIVWQRKLQPGDILVFDNRRTLHGRASFIDDGSKRLLKGCYIDGDDFQSRLRVLRRTQK